MSAVPWVELADFAVFTITGPSLLFVRPREPIPVERAEAILTQFRQLKFASPDVQIVLLPHNFDVFAVGEAELAQRGLVRIP